jgi:peptide subunit release factor 1 (eRF1)
MSWRSKLEDRYTVRCRKCGHESVDPARKPNQKYAKGRCPACDARAREAVKCQGT